MDKKGLLFLIAAPSGTGKTTLAHSVVAQLQATILIERVITYTTRQPRTGEKDGIDYHFLDKTTFLRKIAQNFFLEVTNYNGELYGSPKSIIARMEEGMSFVMVTNRAGVETLCDAAPGALSIWISPPSLSELERRLRSRATESEAEIQQRLAIAQQEMNFERNHRIFTYHLTNRILSETVATLCSLIQQKINEAFGQAHLDKKETNQ